MQGRARSASRLIAASMFSVSALAMWPLSAGAAAADHCLTAPNAPAPRGSHWYYRIERPSLRKCWRLVQKDQQGQTAAARTAPRPEPDNESEAVSAPPASSSAEHAAAPEAPPPPVIRNLLTRNVSNPSDALLPSPPSEPAVNAMPRGEIPNAAAAQERAAPAEPTPVATAEQPVQPVPPPVAAEHIEAPPMGGAPTLRLMLGALALLGFFACAIFFVVEMMRRRSDVLTTVRDAQTQPLEMPPEQPVDADAPTFAPLPPIAMASREDDVDEALRRFAQNMKRRAA